MTAETDTPEAPERFSYTQPIRYELAGPLGTNLDIVVTFAIEVGLQVEKISGGHYRLTGAHKLTEKVREWLTRYIPSGSIAIDVERPPESLNLLFKLTPARPSARTATIHGERSHSLVARAVDAGLTVTCVGLQAYTVTGPTQTLAHWSATYQRIPVAEALEQMNVTAETAAKEDAAAADLPPITINLPVRQTTSVIDRNRDGDIIRFEQTERSIK